MSITHTNTPAQMGGLTPDAIDPFGSLEESDAGKMLSRMRKPQKIMENVKDTAMLLLGGSM